MKTPLVFWFTVCLICVFTSCQKGKCYYHNNLPCGKVYGSVKKVTDSVYSVANGETAYPLQINEYHFDSLNRLRETYCCSYRIIQDELGEEVALSMLHRQSVTYRYDRDGRQVERNTTNCVYLADTTEMKRVSERLIAQEGNTEKWEVTTIHPDKQVSHSEMTCQYQADRMQVDWYDCNTQEKSSFIHVFDEQGNSIACDTLRQQTTVYKATYEIDEFDDEGNWQKRTDFDENKETLYITRRRIEYRVP